MKYFFFLFILFTLFFPKEVFAVDACPGWTPPDNIKSAPTECKMSAHEIKVSIPFPGLDRQYHSYYPYEYQAYKNASGKDVWCYTRPEKKCYYTLGLQQYIRLMYTFFVGVIGIIAVGVMVFGAYRYILARGNSSEAQEGKDMMTSAVGGVVIALLSYMILFTVNPQITKLSIPGLPDVPTIESGAGASDICGSNVKNASGLPVGCGVFFQTNEKNSGDPQYCIGASCATHSNGACILEASSTTGYYKGGSCQNSYQFQYTNTGDPAYDGKVVSRSFDGDRLCGTVDVDWFSHDDVGSKCDAYHQEVAGTCYFVPPTEGYMEMDYTNGYYYIQNALWGCVPL